MSSLTIKINEYHRRSLNMGNKLDFDYIRIQIVIC